MSHSNVKCIFYNEVTVTWRDLQSAFTHWWSIQLYQAVLEAFFHVLVFVWDLKTTHKAILLIYIMEFELWNPNLIDLRLLSVSLLDVVECVFDLTMHISLIDICLLSLYHNCDVDVLFSIWYDDHMFEVFRLCKCDWVILYSQICICCCT